MLNSNELEVLQEDFDRDGFVHIKGFMTSDEIDEMEERVNCFIRDVVPSLPKSIAMYVDFANPTSLKQIECLDKYDQYFSSLTTSSKITGLAKALLHDDIVPKGVHYFSKPPGLSKATPPHQDGYYFCLTPNEAATVWLPLDDMDERNGAITYVAGSHKKGVLSHEASYVLGFSQGVASDHPSEFGREVVCRVKRGDCLVHHSLMIHSAEANASSDRQRRAVSSVYYAKRAQVDPELQRLYKESVERQREALIGQT